MQKEFKDKLGNTYLINGMTPAKVAEASRFLESKGGFRKFDEAAPHTNVDYMAEMARICCASIVTPDGANPLKGLTAPQVREFMVGTAGLASFVLKHAQAVAAEEAAAYETDSGN